MCDGQAKHGRSHQERGGVHVHKLRLALIALAVFNVMDYLFTRWCLNRGFVEANPLMVPIVDTPWFFVIKVVLVPLALYAIWCVRGEIRQVAGAFINLALCVYSALMLYFIIIGVHQFVLAG